AQIHMAPKAPGALDQGGHRRQVTHHHVEIKIQGTLDDLRCNQDPAFTSLSLLAEAPAHRRFLSPTIEEREAGMKQLHLDPCLLQGIEGRDGVIDRIAYPKAGCPASGCGLQ